MWIVPNIWPIVRMKDFPFVRSRFFLFFISWFVYLIYRKRYTQYIAITNMAIETICYEPNHTYLIITFRLCDFHRLKCALNTYELFVFVSICALFSLTLECLAFTLFFVDKRWMNDLISGIVSGYLTKKRKKSNVPHHIRWFVGCFDWCSQHRCHRSRRRFRHNCSPHASFRPKFMINMHISSGFSTWCLIKLWIEFKWDFRERERAQYKKQFHFKSIPSGATKSR